MKKIINTAKWILVAVAAASIVIHFDVGREVTCLVKNVAQKLTPWMNAVVYS